jgi:hypothetical protein
MIAQLQIVLSILIILLQAIIAQNAFSDPRPAQPAHLIREYDGIPFGAKLQDVPAYLAKQRGVNRSSDGRPIFERVPTKTYYRYHINRSPDRKKDQSEVNVFIRNGRVYQFKDVFDGDWSWDIKKAEAHFKILTDIFTKRWGQPERKTAMSVHWIRDDGQAILTFERPSSPRGLPIIKLIVKSK